MQDRPGWNKELVETVAYWLWHEDGAHDDHALQYWFEAETLLQGERIQHDPKYAKLLQILCGRDGNR